MEEIEIEANENVVRYWFKFKIENNKKGEGKARKEGGKEKCKNHEILENKDRGKLPKGQGGCKKGNHE